MRNVGVAAACLLFGFNTAFGQTLTDAKRQPGDIEFRDRWVLGAADIKEARAILQCRVAPESQFDSCQVMSEFPAGLHFGGLAEGYVKNLRLRMSDTVGTRVTLAFHMDKPASMPRRFDVQFDGMVWEKTPTWNQVQAVFPVNSKATEADVRLRCSVDETGGLQECKAILEAPNKQGFGEAAKALAPKFKAKLPSNMDMALLKVTTDFWIHFAKSADGDGRKLTAPQWTHGFDLDRANALYPASATAARVDKGEAQVRCGVTDEGRLENCSTISESPSGFGFGDAAKQAAAEMTMNPWAPAGYPVGGLTLTFPVKFNGP